jgi:hypothetical protein
MTVAQIGSSNVDQRIVELLEGYLEDAKAGRLVSIGVVTGMTNAEVSSAFVADNRPVNLVGELEILKRDLIDCQVDLRLHEAGTEY